MSQPDRDSRPHCAAAYVRMSDNRQRYCTINQLEAIRGYARRHGLEVVRVFSDEGRSGLTIGGRPALLQLIGQVLAENADFAHILVYDVSRWGRFQNTDEAAHYEFLCHQAGMTIHYCAEEFSNDGSLTSLIAKGLKRAMAGEYSRELSVRVFRATSRLVKLGLPPRQSDVQAQMRVHSYFVLGPKQGHQVKFGRGATNNSYCWFVDLVELIELGLREVSDDEWIASFYRDGNPDSGVIPSDEWGDPRKGELSAIVQALQNKREAEKH